jgi:predicted porin
MQFKKLPLAIALGSLLMGSAAIAAGEGEGEHSAGSSMQLYGKLYPYFLHEKGSGPSAVGTPVSTLSAPATGTLGTPGINGMTAGNSRWGLRGQEDMGGGNNAIFQLESQVKVDDGSGAGPGLTFNRNTFVGLEGHWGEVKLGNHDTILKEYGDTIGFLGLSSGTFMSTSNVLRKTGFCGVPTGCGSASSFHLRRINSIIYETPEIGGFTGGLQWSTDEVPSNVIHQGKVYSMGVKWDNGPFYVALAHEIHKDLFGGSRNAPASQSNFGTADPTHSTDKATQFTVEWRPTKQHKFEFDAIRKGYNESATVAGRFQNYHNMAYLLATESRWGDKWRTSAHIVLSKAGSCTRVAAACNTDGLEGKQITLGGAYYFSKRTYLWSAVSRLINGKSARYNNNDFDQAPNPGEDINHFAIGISHSF